MFERRWRNLKLQNQILILQGVVVAAILTILIIIGWELVSRFSIFIKHELFQTLILKSMVNTIQITSKQTNKFQYLQYQQQQIDTQSLENLFKFYVSNKIQFATQLDDCLMSQHSQQFYSYQFCYGIYGQEYNQSVQTDFNQIKDFISLQNLFIPLWQSSQSNVRYNILMDESLFFAQYKGEYLPQLQPEIMEAFNLMRADNMSTYYNEILQDKVKITIEFSVIGDTNIATGNLNVQTEDQYYQISQQDRFFNQRYLIAIESGDIFYDSKSFGFTAQNQNIMDPTVIRFDEKKFQKIKNFTFDNLAIDSECDFNFEKQFICLLDLDGQPKIIQPIRTTVDIFSVYFIIVLDGKSTLQTVNDFDKQLRESIWVLTFNILIYLIVILVVCIVLQGILIRKLNKPLQDLQDIAKLHMNNQQYHMLTGINVIKQQFQIQQLADSFFNLINLNQKSKNQKKRFIKTQTIKMRDIQGLLKQRFQSGVIKVMRKQIIALIYRHE